LKNARRTTPRHKSGPFSSQKSAQVHLNRLSSQFKKKLKHGSPSDIVDTVTTEIGWVGLVALFACFIIIIYIIIALTLSGDSNNGGKPTIHGDHATVFQDIDEADPEHWPHHLRESLDGKREDIRVADDAKELLIDDLKKQRRDRNSPRDRAMDGKLGDIPDAERKKMEEYLEEKERRKQKRPRSPRDRARDRDRRREGIPDDINIDDMSLEEREDLLNERRRKRRDKRGRPDRAEREKERRDRERAIIEENMKNRREGEPIDIDKLKEDLQRVEDDLEIDDGPIADKRRRERRRDRKMRDKPRKDRERPRERQRERRNDADEYGEEDGLLRREDEERFEVRERDALDQMEQFEMEAEEKDTADDAGKRVEDAEEMGNWATIWNSIRDIDMSGEGIPAESEDSLTEKAYKVKAAFLHAWHGYAKHAMGHDEIQPVSDLPGDSWGGLGATLIDALDTMMIMGIVEEFKEARDVLEKVNFATDLQVSFFETTIRHLGGLIGAYELSRILKPKDDVILKQAVALADHLLPAFNTKMGIPKSMVNLQTGDIKNYGWTKDRSVLSEVGSNQLEMYAMSEYTDDPKYYDRSANVLSLLDAANGNNGLYPRLIETDSASFPKNEKVFSLGGMSDSFYEYLLKTWILSDYNDKLAIKMYVQSIAAANEQLLRKITDKKRREEPYYFYGEQWYSKFRGKMEELECFMPGLLALGSYHAILRHEHSKKTGIPLSEWEQALFDARTQHGKLAHVLVESCVALYSEMPTGLAPESIEFSDGEWNPKEMKYQLRPETVESLFILYSLTGNEQYRQWAWSIFESIEKHCRTEVAYSGIKDVTEIPAKPDNQMQSYVMAETFKYLYLMFDEYAAKLLPLNEFVFNTEAHPIRIIGNIKDLKWYRPEVFSKDRTEN